MSRELNKLKKFKKCLNKTLSLMHIVWGWIPPQFYNFATS